MSSKHYGCRVGASGILPSRKRMDFECSLCGWMAKGMSEVITRRTTGGYRVVWQREYLYKKASRVNYIIRVQGLRFKLTLGKLFSDKAYYKDQGLDFKLLGPRANTLPKP